MPGIYSTNIGIKLHCTHSLYTSPPNAIPHKMCGSVYVLAQFFCTYMCALILPTWGVPSPRSPDGQESSIHVYLDITHNGDAQSSTHRTSPLTATSVDGGDFQAGLRAGSSSCAKEPQSKHQRLDETLIFSQKSFCTQRRSRAHFDPAARRCRGMRFPGSFCFARGCVPFSDAMSIRYAHNIKLTAVICSTYY